MQLRNIATAENDFFCEETLVTIMPSIDMDRFMFISGTYGPLQKGNPSMVPVWLADTLHKKGKCTIVLPSTSEMVSSLERQIASERAKGLSEGWEEVDFYYFEKVRMFSSAYSDRALGLIKDFENIRFDKMRAGLQSLAVSSGEGNITNMVGFKNVCALELMTVRTFLMASMKVFDRLVDREE